MDWILAPEFWFLNSLLCWWSWGHQTPSALGRHPISHCHQPVNKL